MEKVYERPVLIALNEMEGHGTATHCADGSGDTVTCEMGTIAGLRCQNGAGVISSGKISFFFQYKEADYPLISDPRWAIGRCATYFVVGGIVQYPGVSSTIVPDAKGIPCTGEGVGRSVIVKVVRNRFLSIGGA